jgi:hypothetical protein
MLSTKIDKSFSDWDIVLQYQHTERLRSYSTPDTLCHLACQAQRPVLTCQSHDQLLLHANSRHTRCLHDQGVLDSVCCHDGYLLYGFVLLQQVADVGYGDPGRVGKAIQQVLCDGLDKG